MLFPWWSAEILCPRESRQYEEWAVPSRDVFQAPALLAPWSRGFTGCGCHSLPASCSIEYLSNASNKPFLMWKSVFSFQWLPLSFCFYLFIHFPIPLFSENLERKPYNSGGLATGAVLPTNCCYHQCSMRTMLWKEISLPARS